MRVFRSKKLEPMHVLPDGGELPEIFIRWPGGNQFRAHLIKVVQIDDNAIVKFMTRDDVEFVVNLKDEEKL